MESLREYLRGTQKFLREVWIEVRPNKGRVAWPTFENIKLTTKAVVISSILMGAFIGIIDVIFNGVLTWVIGIKG